MAEPPSAGAAVRPDAHYALVAAAIDYLRRHARRQPTLAELAGALGPSEAHLQRVFAEWAGVSPKRFLQYLTKQHAVAALRNASTVLEAALDAGLSGPSRLHDLTVTCEAMTPGEIGRGGDGVEIGHGFAGTPFGQALIGWTSRGVCHFAFCDTDETAWLEELRRRWPLARLHASSAEAEALAARIFPRVPGRGQLHLVLRGSNFQLKVWEALLRLAPGECTSYGRLAAAVGAPAAHRAAGSAVAANCIGYLIPCHRVIRNSGDAGEYRWGGIRKQALLGWEAARAESAGGEPACAQPTGVGSID